MISDEENPVNENPVNAEDLFGEDIGTSTANKDTGATTVEPKKKKVINRLPPLNQAWILNEKHEGISKVNSYFKGIKLKSGHGHELTNLKVILKRYEYWGQQCYPRLCFQDFVEKVETLSGKKEIRNFLQQNRIKNQSTVDFSLTSKLSPSKDSNEIMFGGDSPEKPNQIIGKADELLLINDNLRATIARKREEAIAKRKLKLEQSINQPSEEKATDFTIDGTQDDSEANYGDDLVIDTDY